MDLYIIRHAIAVESGTSGYEDDSQRPLTEKGREKMEKIARGLHALEVRFDVILSSPYRRARETAQVLAGVFSMDKVAISENLAPPGNLAGLVREINENYAHGSLALVGHEPILSTLISLLVAGDSGLLINMKKGGVCYLTVGTLRPERCANLEWLLPPAVLAGIRA